MRPRGLSSRRAFVAWAEVRVGALHVANCEAQEARDAYERALRIVPGYGFAREHLAEWHAAQGHWAEAGRIFRELIEDKRDARLPPRPG